MRPSAPIIAGGALVALGAFLPWASAGPLSASGVNLGGGDGRIALVLGGLLIVLGFVAAMQTTITVRVIAGLAVLLAGYIGIWNWRDINSLTIVDTGPGPLVICLGAVVALVGIVTRDPATDDDT